MYISRRHTIQERFHRNRSSIFFRKVSIRTAEYIKVADVVDVDVGAIEGLVGVNAVDEVHPRLRASGVVRAGELGKLRKRARHIQRAN